jgi:hypothetical protein
MVVRRQDATIVMGRPAGPPGEPYTFIATVVNLGSEAVTIEDVGWRCDSGGYSEVSVHRLRQEPKQTVDGPDLPCQVEGRGTATWRIPGTTICSRFGGIEDSTLYAWAHRFASRRPWPWPEQRRIGLKVIESDGMASPCPVAIREYRARLAERVDHR